MAKHPRKLKPLESSLGAARLKTLGAVIAGDLDKQAIGDNQDGKEAKDTDKLLASLAFVENNSTTGLHLARAAKGRWLHHKHNVDKVKLTVLDTKLGSSRPTNLKMERLYKLCERFPGAIALDIPYAWFDSASIWKIKVLAEAIDNLKADSASKSAWTTVPDWVTDLQNAKDVQNP